jgi:hypothetical protein
MSNHRSDPAGIPRWLLLPILLLIPSILGAQSGDTTLPDSIPADTAVIRELVDSVTTQEIDSADFFAGLDSAAIALLYDSTAVEPRLPSASSIEALREDDRLRYDVEGHTPETMWDRILSWLRDLLGLALQDPAIVKLIEWTFYIIAGLVLSFALWKLITGTHSGLLAGGSGGEGVTLGAIEDINAIDFDPLIERAIRERDFRGATRLLYLKGLRRLSERNLIEWRRDRMNRDYLHQLGRSELADPFARCTLLFEYVWYGDFPVDEKTFTGIAGTLRAFISRVEAGR